MSGPVPRHGRVARPDGAPASNALVWVEAGSAPTPEIAIQADGNGRFRVALPAGRFRLKARAPDGEEGEATVEVDETSDRELQVTVTGPQRAS